MVGLEDSYHSRNIEKIRPMMVEVFLLVIDMPWIIMIIISLVVSMDILDIAAGHSSL